MSQSLDMPRAQHGFVPTLNRQGFMNTRVDASMLAFITSARASVAPVVDIGAAYGVATIPALEAGANVIAVDVDERHLEILKRRVPMTCLKRLRTISASFPEGFQLDNDSIGAFLVSNVVHFLSPSRLQLAAKCLFDWLIVDGKVFLTAATPYLGDCKSFVPEYEAGMRAGELWPGSVTDVMRYAPRWQSIASSLLLLDPGTLSRVFRDAGFIIEKAEFIARPDLPPHTQLDGRESVELIVRKPRA
jgi:SAM-dependent methyltransferase